ncbi:PP2C family protein-serine/threonine phosphatase [Pacificoceanicola onchidii]|uniref:PP2C family protein-serine/threonine phosphatase n=1 Tax=Pacificoceanicola onchidii TaxID=2562685 RepID=UPI0010A5C316|nr:SpoIIE family protein phosphatase [Pacificoceanicola onchidii]
MRLRETVQARAKNELNNEPDAVRRVLIVDDSPMQLKIVSSMLARSGFDVLQAKSGLEALEICAQTPPDLVLSDWMMPGMDGLEFCRRFREIQDETYGYFILLTSKSDKGDVAQGLDAGADDFLTKPVNAHELRARINAGARVVSMERQLSEKNRQISEAFSELQSIHEAIDNDLKQARKIQQALVPERVRTFGTSRVSLLLQPCGHVGGDLVGMFAPGLDRMGLYSIDVSGHGITSAMVTARVAGYMSSAFPDQNIALEKRSDQNYLMREPALTGQMLNERLAADPGVEEYLTMAFVSADLKSGDMQMIQAGHPPPILLRRNGAVEFLGSGGLPIGLVDEVMYDQVGFKMECGDRLLLYSDGFTEAVMKDGSMLEEEGLADIFRKSVETGGEGPELLEDMFWRLTADMENAESLGDDVSAALLEFDAVSQP